MIRAKFICITKEYDLVNPVQGNVTLQPVISGSEENKQFFNATPDGSILLSLLNPQAFAQFEPGKEYYVDFSAVENAETIEIQESVTSTNPNETAEKLLQEARNELFEQQRIDSNRDRAVAITHLETAILWLHKLEILTGEPKRNE